MPRVYNDSLPSQGLPARWLGLLFVLALALRTWSLTGVQADAYLASPKADSLYFLEWARSIHERSFWGRHLFVQSPLYPYLLAAAGALFSDPLIAIRLFQVLLGCLVPVGVAMAAQRLTRHPGSALLAGLVAAAYGPFLFYTALILKETLAIVLVTGFFLLALRAADRHKLAVWGSSGLVLGLLWLVRANAPLLALPVLVWIGTDRGAGLRRRAAAGLAFCLGLVLPVAPLTLHNLVVADQFAITLASGGSNFYVGNNPDATGLYLRAAGRQRRSPVRGLGSGRRRLAHGRPAAQRRRGLGRLRACRGAVHPHTAAGLGLADAAQVPDLLERVEIPDNYDYGFFAARLPLLRYLFQFPFVAAFGLAGLALRARERSVRLLRWEVLVSMVSVVLFYVNARFRVVLVPLLLMGCALSFKALIQGVWLRPLVVALAVFALTHSPICDSERGRVTAFSWSRYGDFLLDQERFADAGQAFVKAYSYNANDAYANRGLGVVALQRHDYLAAAFHSMEALRLGAEDPELYQRIVTALIARGRRDEALDFLRQAIRVEPDKPQPRELLKALGETTEEPSAHGPDTP